MKPAPFDYMAPETLHQALEMLLDSDREVKVLAGGQSLIPVMNMRMGSPEVLVDIGRIPELGELTVDDEGSLRIGCAVRQSTLLSDERITSHWPMLQSAIGLIGHPQIRARGTVCGSLAHADPAAELPAVALAAGATMTVNSCRGERALTAEEFFQGPFTTAMDDDEILTEAIFPEPVSGMGWGFDEFATRRGDFATVGAAVTLQRIGETVDSCRVVLFGVGGTAVRIPAAENAIIGARDCHETISAAKDSAEAALGTLSDDIHASGAYRVETAVRLVGTTVKKAWDRSYA